MIANIKEKAKMKLYLVEIIRYGSMAIYPFGIFNKPKKEIHKIMKDYNSFRGGKYPKYRITEFKLNKEMPFETNIKTFKV